MLRGVHSAILLTFIKLPFAIKIFVLSIFQLLFYIGFTVVHSKYFRLTSGKKMGHFKKKVGVISRKK